MRTHASSSRKTENAKILFQNKINATPDEMNSFFFSIFETFYNYHIVFCCRNVITHA